MCQPGAVRELLSKDDPFALFAYGNLQKRIDLFGNRHSRENGKLDAKLGTLDSRHRGNDKLGVSEQV